MSFRDAAKAAMQWNIERKIQVVRTGLAASLDSVRISSEGLERIGVRPEEALGQTIFPSTKFAIPVRGELIVRELAGIG